MWKGIWYGEIEIVSERDYGWWESVWLVCDEGVFWRGGSEMVWVDGIFCLIGFVRGKFYEIRKSDLIGIFCFRVYNKGFFCIRF